MSNVKVKRGKNTKVQFAQANESVVVATDERDTHLVLLAATLGANSGLGTGGEVVIEDDDGFVAKLTAEPGLGDALTPAAPLAVNGNLRVTTNNVQLNFRIWYGRQET